MNIKTIIITFLLCCSLPAYSATDVEYATELTVCAAAYHLVYTFLLPFGEGQSPNPELSKRAVLNRKALLAKTQGKASREYVLKVFEKATDKITDSAIDSLDKKNKLSIDEIILHKYDRNCSGLL